MNWMPIEIQPFEPAVVVLMIITPFATRRWWRSNTDRNSKTQQSYREILIENVSNNWIKGVLEETLKDARFDIKVDTRTTQAGDPRDTDYKQPAVDREQPTALKAMINAVLRRQNERNPLSSAAQVIPQIFHDVSEKLLILGAPGSGKTVLLLELAKALLQEAKEDAAKSVPVVFNLSSWAVKRQSLRDWLIAELKGNYGVNGNLAKQWIDGDSLIYLLDGLDEVEIDHRNHCLNVINDFISPTRQIVISSRTEEYAALSTKLNTHNAIELLPLDKGQVESVFEQHLNTDTVEALMEWISTVDAIWREVNKPLFINILINTYVGGKLFSRQSLEAGTKRQIQQLIIEPFLMQRLRNNPNGHISNENIWRYLSWIAYNLKERNLSQFYVEMLQGDWLFLRSRKSRSKLSIKWLVRHFSVDVERKFAIIPRQIRFGVIFGIKTALYFVIPLVLISHAILQFIGTSSTNLLTSALFLIMGFVGSSIIASLSEHTQISQRSYFNQGLTDTLRLGSIFGLTAGFFFGLRSGITMALISGSVFGLLHGRLSEVIKHVILRITLRHEQLAPRRYDRFLQLIVDRRIMRRVGGSAIFVHRYILEYFADQWEQKYQQDYD